MLLAEGLQLKVVREELGQSPFSRSADSFWQIAPAAFDEDDHALERVLRATGEGSYARPMPR